MRRVQQAITKKYKQTKRDLQQWANKSKKLAKEQVHAIKTYNKKRKQHAKQCKATGQKLRQYFLIKKLANKSKNPKVRQKAKKNLKRAKKRAIHSYKRYKATKQAKKRAKKQLITATKKSAVHALKTAIKVAELTPPIPGPGLIVKTGAKHILRKGVKQLVKKKAKQTLSKKATKKVVTRAPKLPPKAPKPPRKTTPPAKTVPKKAKAPRKPRADKPPPTDTKQLDHVMKQTGKTKSGKDRLSQEEWRKPYGPAKPEKHHLTPQELGKKGYGEVFNKRLQELGLSEKYIHRNIVKLPRITHNRIHKGGWNPRWKQWLKQNPNFTKKQLDAQIKKMMKDFGIPKSLRGQTGSYLKKGAPKRTPPPKPRK